MKDPWPSMYGWKCVYGSLCPIPFTLDPAPEPLMNVQKCACKTDCKGRCSCFKNKAHCSNFCTCDNDKCSNKPHQSVEDQEHDECDDAVLAPVLDEDSCSDSDQIDSDV